MKQYSVISAALGSAPVTVIGNQLPADIQWMPPGKHKVTATKGASQEPVTLELEVTAEVGALMQRCLQDYCSKAATGQEDRPYFDFNHEDGEASAHVMGFYWGGTDPVSGGVRARVEWTEPGKEALLGRAYRRFSPSFWFDDGEFVGAPLNMGGLVNRAAFKTIQPIWSRHGGDQKQPTEKEKADMKTIEEQLADTNAAVTKLATDTNAAITKLTETVTTFQTKLVGLAMPDKKEAAADPKIAALETQVTALIEANKVQAKANAGIVVRKAISEGKIPPQDAKLIEHWTNVILLDAKNAELLESAPVNPALKKVIDGQGKNGTSASAGLDAHPFIVKAKEYATANKLDEQAAQAKFAATPDGAKLYQEYLEGFKAQQN